jgi:sec-independent protein translocase protein TatA
MFYSKPWLDALIVLLVVLLFIGPKRLPAFGKSLGQGMKEFKDSITGNSTDEEDERPALTEASGSAPAETAAPAGAPSETTVSAAGQSQSAKVASSEHSGPIHRGS